MKPKTTSSALCVITVSLLLGACSHPSVKEDTEKIVSQPSSGNSPIGKDIFEYADEMQKQGEKETAETKHLDPEAWRNAKEIEQKTEQWTASGAAPATTPATGWDQLEAKADQEFRNQDYSTAENDYWDAMKTFNMSKGDRRRILSCVGVARCWIATGNTVAGIPFLHNIYDEANQFNLLSNDPEVGANVKAALDEARAKQ